jgi:hypothetical protein
MQRIWKEAVMAYSSHYPGICMEELKKSMKNNNRIASTLTQISTEHLLNPSPMLW